MFFRTLTAPLVALAIAVGAVGAVGSAQAHEYTLGDLTLHEAKARTTIPNRPTAIYLMISNAGEADDRLVAASSPFFEVMELHKSEMNDGVMSMAAVEAILVPAGGDVVLEPGGLHVMAFGATRAIKEGDMFEISLTFEKAGKIDIIVHGAKIKGGHSHGGHDHGGHSGHNHGSHSGHNHGTTN
ncbi:MAG: copper chaperone PCu(A)C [Pseudomonadota bacterium]